MSFVPRPLAFVAFAVSTLATGCDSASPTEPAGDARVLVTRYGDVAVYPQGLAFDGAKAAAAVEAAYARGRSQVGPAIDRIRLDGMSVVVETSVFDGAAVGQYLPSSDTVAVSAGVESVLTHELQHRFCYNLGRHGDCCTLQDHQHGYDLLCNRRP